MPIASNWKANNIMARSFRRKRQSHPISELNITNLVDLGFTLLIIFMIATPLINKEQTIPLDLPTESKNVQVKPDPKTQFIAISIDARGQFFIDAQQSPSSIGDLRTLFQSHAADIKKPVIRIRGDAKVPYEKVIQLMDELKKSDLTNISFDTQTDS